MTYNVISYYCSKNQRIESVKFIYTIQNIILVEQYNLTTNYCQNSNEMRNLFLLHKKCDQICLRLSIVKFFRNLQNSAGA